MGYIMHEAIEFQLGATKILEVRYGVSSFKPIEDFWTDFKPHGGEKTTAFLPCVCKRTARNEAIVENIRKHYEDLKKFTDETDKLILKLRNTIEK